jgi:NAD(P)H dehydrogenase (quinone)
MNKIVIVYHSGYGHTKKQAEAVYAGIEHPDVERFLISVDEVSEDTWQLFHEADAIIFGAPTYMGGVSAEFKKFADSTSKPWLKQEWKNKIAAGFTNSGSMNGDKLSSIQYLWALSQQHGMIWVGTGMLPANHKASQRNDINYLGSFSGLMAQSPVDGSPEEGPLPGDLETAKLFGKRVREISQQLTKGRY